ERAAPRGEHSDAGMQQGTAKERQAATTTLLQLLGRQSESSLARVQMNQLTALQAQQRGEEAALTLELPLFSGKESDVVQLQIRRETKQDAGEAEACWSVTLKLDNDEYGVIRAVVSLAAGKVATTFWCEQPPTQQHFAQHLEELRHRLREQGLEPGQTQAFAGQPPPADTPHGTRHNDHLINTRA
ncbi:MAG: flagellar hook-length control protein FliK, partial [Gammaproteobacteria bacterium]|nr:flagellar hook-length control protein FliK [Gammaproteobacteria bacterium]